MKEAGILIKISERFECKEMTDSADIFEFGMISRFAGLLRIWVFREEESSGI